MVEQKIATLDMKNNNIHKKRLVLLDAHAILHRAYHGMPEFTDREGNPTGALYGYMSMIARIKNDLKPDYIAACYDLPRPTFRHLAYDDYKGHRAKTDDALVSQIKMSYDICKALNIPIYSSEGFEADDVIGTIAEQMTRDHKDIETIIASGDMDTMQLIDENVKVYTLKKANEAALFDTQAVIDKYGFPPIAIAEYKSIAGDTSDNIIGVPGIGVKGATDLIQKYNTLDNIYKAIEVIGFNSKENGLKDRTVKLLLEHKDSAEFSLTLATIRRDAPIAFILTSWVVDESDYLSICNRFNFNSLKNKFNDYMDKESESSISLGKDGEMGDKEMSEKEKSKNEIKNLNKSEYKDLQTMMNLINSEMVSADIESIFSYLGLLLQNKNILLLLSEARDSLILKLKSLKIKNKIANDNYIHDMYDYYKVIEEPLLNIIKSIKDNGIVVDKSILTEQSKKLHLLIDRLEHDIYELSGEEFNINSPKQLAEIIYDKLGLGDKIKKTKTGQKSTNAEMLLSMVDEHPIIHFIISYRELYKLVSTYIDTLPDFVAEDGRIHASLILNGAATGRFSCEHPNLQNLPAKRGEAMEIRKAFMSSKGKKLLSLDYSQIELRLAAILSGDEEMIDIFARGADVHAGVAALVYNKKEQDINSDERRHAKAINFGILYGMGVTALKDSMGVDRKTAQDFYDKYKSTFVTLMIYLEKVKQEAHNNGYSETLFGRRRQIPMIRSSLPFIRAQGERIAINAPVQGAGAEIIKLAMIDIYNFIKNDKDQVNKIKLLLQIHDELIFEIDENDNESEKIIKKIMESVLSSRGEHTVPIEVSSVTGISMFDLK